MMASETVLITAGPYQFLGVLESAAPKTVQLLPQPPAIQTEDYSRPVERKGDVDSPGGKPTSAYLLKIIRHIRQQARSYCPGGFSETEFLFCYGGVSFASKMGPLAANHFLTITEGRENLHALGELVLWSGAQDVAFQMADEAT
ncbi:Protein of unknown function DUF3830 [Penicillium chermesinum]|nr:Protein of unknown function DUF3830 [Penicillium chermesinum]